jgi:hypothetical protein
LVSVLLLQFGYLAVGVVLFLFSLPLLCLVVFWGLCLFWLTGLFRDFAYLCVYAYSLPWYALCHGLEVINKFICFDINKLYKYYMVLFDIPFHFSFAISSFRAKKKKFFIMFLFYVSLNLLYRSMKLYICFEIFSYPIQQRSLYP